MSMLVLAKAVQRLWFWLSFPDLMLLCVISICALTVEYQLLLVVRYWKKCSTGVQRRM